VVASNVYFQSSGLVWLLLCCFGVHCLPYLVICWFNVFCLFSCGVCFVLVQSLVSLVYLMERVVCWDRCVIRYDGAMGVKGLLCFVVGIYMYSSVWSGSLSCHAHSWCSLTTGMVLISVHGSLICFLALSLGSTCLFLCLCCLEWSHGLLCGCEQCFVL
jgi:hypothetical protein